MKNILVLGATGLFGKAFVKELEKIGKYKITAFSRHATNVYETNDLIIPFDGDALNHNNLLDAMKNIDVVYCAISGSNLPKITKNIIKAMNEMKLSRLIFMGAIGIYNEIPVELDDEDNVKNNPDQIPNLEAVTLVENSNLNYTVLRPGYLIDGNKDNFEITMKGQMATGYESTILAVINIAIKLIDDNTLYSRQSIGITKIRVLKSYQ